MAQAPDTDIVIAGGGPVGMAQALAIAGPGARAKLSVALVNPQPLSDAGKPQSDGRAYNLAASSMRMLAALGLGEALAPHAQPIHDIIVTDDGDGGARPPLLNFDNRDETPAGAGQPASYIIAAEHLNAALAEAVLAAPAIEVFEGERVAAPGAPGAALAVRLGSGREIRTRLLIAADGRASPLRAAMGLKSLSWPHHQTAIVMAVQHEEDHLGRAYEHFRAPGPFAVLPLPGGHQSSLVWTERPDEAKRLMELDDEAFAAELELRCGTELGKVRPAGKRFAYPLTGVLARDYIAPRFALIGDAAHGIHPIAGQGVNLGYRGVAALAEVLSEAAFLGRDIGAVDVLEAYQQWRRFDAMALVAGCAALNELFANDNGLVRAMRDLGLGAVERIAPLKRYFVNEAAGSHGDLPRLLLGEPV